MNLARLDQILENSSLPWWQWDVANNIVTFNKLKVTILGYKESDFRGCNYQAFTDLLHPDDYNKTMNAMRVVLEGKAELYQTDYRIRNSNNEYQWYLDRGFVIENDNNRPTVIRGIVINLGRYQNEFDHAQKIIELLNESKIYYESHEKHIIVLCANCKKVNIDTDQWITVDMDVIHLMTETISHGICPDCVRRLYPDMADRILSKNIR